MNYTDKQLKQALAKMIPTKVNYNDCGENDIAFSWKDGTPILDTELLHLCWLVENTLTRSKECDYFVSLSMRSSWQQRVEALAEVKGIDIV